MKHLAPFLLVAQAILMAAGCTGLRAGSGYTPDAVAVEDVFFDRLQYVIFLSSTASDSVATGLEYSGPFRHSYVQRIEGLVSQVVICNGVGMCYLSELTRGQEGISRLAVASDVARVRWESMRRLFERVKARERQGGAQEPSRRGDAVG